MRLYLDANTIIYSVEAVAGFQAGVLRRVQQVEAAAGLLITSRLSLLECRVQPLRQGDHETLARYDEFFSGANLVLLDVSSDVIDQATELRARYLFRSADAGLSRCTEIRVVTLTAEPNTTT